MLGWGRGIRCLSLGWRGGIRTPDPGTRTQCLTAWPLATIAKRQKPNTLIIIGIRVTFRDPATSSLKTNFQEKIALRIANSNSHPDPGTRTRCLTTWPIPIVHHETNLRFFSSLVGKAEFCFLGKTKLAALFPKESRRQGVIIAYGHLSLKTKNY
jgi:hypothetical protein